MARSHDLELCGGGIAQCDAATVRAAVLMCDAANCACVSVDVWYSGADILTQATEPASLIDSPLYLHTGMSFVLRTPVRAGSMLVRADPRREQTGHLVGM